MRDSTGAAGERAGPTYRVWKIDPALKDAVTAKRDRARTTTRALVRDAVEAELPALMAALAELGVAVESAEGARRRIEPRAAR